MKRKIAIGLSLCLIVLGVTACGPKASAPAAGSASPEDMLKMLPAEAQGVFFIDVHNAMAIQSVDTAIKDTKDYQKYLEFIETTGIDPKEDVHYVAAAVMSGMMGQGEGSGDGAGIVNLKYDPEALLKVIKAKADEDEKEYREVPYQEMTIYLMEAEEGDEGGFAFIDDSNAVVGTETGIKAVIDVIKGLKDNLYKNPELAALMDKTRKDTLFWGAMLVPAEAAEQAASNPMLSSLGGVKAVTMNFDYKNNTLMAEIRAQSSDAAQNDQIAAALNGIKAFGSMAAAEKPEIGELMNAIQITAAEDHVKIAASIPEELLTKLKASAMAEKEQQ